MAQGCQRDRDSPMTRLLLIILLLPAICFAETETLRPNAVGTTTQWTDYPSAGDNYADVDEVSTDDADYVSTATHAYVDLYNLGATAIPANSIISSLKVWVRAKGTLDGTEETYGFMKVGVRPASTNRLHATQITLTDAFANYSREWTTNPDTTREWRYYDLDNLQAEIYAVLIGSAGSTITVSQVWVEITYTLSGSPAGVRGYQGGSVARATNTTLQVRGKQ